MRIIGAHPEEYYWIADRAGCDITPNFQAIKAVDDSGRIHGMVGYNGWTANSVIMHIALDNPACFRSLIQFAFRYPFEDCGRGVAFATVREKNVRSVALCKHVGFEVAYRLRDAIQVGEDMILFQMRRENCRWVSRKAA